METEMQQLGKRNTYTPLGASQAHRSVTMSLNREETLSEHGSKTFSNNLDVNQQSSKTERRKKLLLTQPKLFEKAMLLEENGVSFPASTLNRTYKLKDFRDSVLNQESLLKYLDPEIVCNGGCFL